MFTDFAAWALREIPDLALLSYTRAAGGICSCSGPSWAPCHDMDGLPNSLTDVRHFKAFGSRLSRTACFPHRVFKIDEGKNLTLTGAFIDRVLTVSTTVHDLANLTTQNQHVKAAMIFAKRHLSRKWDWDSRSRKGYWKFCVALVFGMDQLRKPTPDFIRSISDFVAGNRVDSVRDSMLYWSRYRRLCVTSGDRLAWVPWRHSWEAKPKDRICIFHGSCIPYVVRRRRDGSGTYILVGECWIQGLMGGKALQLAGFKEESIVLS
ncbi:hypothetical protein GQ44DRAFT_719770 [Phaeosphaeriaceae sp. PMI808]|nr:hypothetical protein GQ44DRAFT_719770 [Phaeosphaeriaceae sp. PMI808]